MRGLGGNPFDLAITDVAGVATAMFAEKASASRVNSFLSMCSVTQQLLHPTRPPLKDDPVIVGIRAATRRLDSGKRVRPDHYYDLNPIFTHLEAVHWGSPVKQQKLKAITLLMIDLFARSSDLARIFREQIRFFDDRMELFIRYPKECKTDTSVAMTVYRYRADPDWCSVTAVQAYIDSTSTWDIDCVCEGGEWFTPLFLHDSKSRGDSGALAFRALHAQRISKLVKGLLNVLFTSYEWPGHSLRGAASSKVINLRPDLRAPVHSRGRWADPGVGSSNFDKSYLKRCVYDLTGHLADRGPMLLEEIIRLPARRL